MTQLEKMLDDVRINKGMTRNEFAKNVIGVAYPTYMKIVKCPRECYIKMTISKVAKVLGISNTDVLRYGETEYNEKKE